MSTHCKLRMCEHSAYRMSTHCKLRMCEHSGYRMFTHCKHTMFAQHHLEYHRNVLEVSREREGSEDRVSVELLTWDGKLGFKVLLSLYGNNLKYP